MVVVSLAVILALLCFLSGLCDREPATVGLAAFLFGFLCLCEIVLMLIDCVHEEYDASIRAANCASGCAERELVSLFRADCLSVSACLKI